MIKNEIGILFFNEKIKENILNCSNCHTNKHVNGLYDLQDWSEDPWKEQIKNLAKRKKWIMQEHLDQELKEIEARWSDWHYMHLYCLSCKNGFHNKDELAASKEEVIKKAIDKWNINQKQLFLT